MKEQKVKQCNELLKHIPFSLFATSGKGGWFKDRDLFVFHLDSINVQKKFVHEI